ncbi:hypothetical protein [Streptomyces sp. NPDC002722]|uniref:DUF7848 domain-containing protein n=1 Tax=Streptomyces sp. NPDC002722 TaxID=3154425 RepID=UPI00331A544A
MSPRALIRSVAHRIVHHRDLGMTFKAACMACNWTASPSPDSAAVDIECLKHAGRSNHRGFHRTAASFAYVVRDGE